ncbi:MAG: nucleotidyltransferase [Lachnospiraceae bacterium]|nr:nucleotidyltransferase [Lachnospiraceae bacterium]
MTEPTLVILAAGMGSRYGGAKQIDPIDPQGHVIIDFSMYDAIRAGFRKIVFIIKREHEQIFHEKIGARVAPFAEVAYAYQELDDLPEGYSVPDGRGKPWGTAHAILCCRNVVDGPFAIINADDYYGREAFSTIYSWLAGHEDGEKLTWSMVGYLVENTLSESGTVTRGVCEVDENRFLTGIRETSGLGWTDGRPSYPGEDGAPVFVPAGTVVSMNLWGFSRGLFAELAAGFPAFLDKGLAENPMKCEYLIPSVVGDLVAQEKATVEVLESRDKWYGVTYKEDKPAVVEAIARMKAEGIYPEELWKEAK